MGKDPWKHRTKGMLCESCMFCVEKVADDTSGKNISIGRCRRRAPTLGGYPVVFMTDWCGEHKLDENKV